MGACVAPSGILPGGSARGLIHAVVVLLRGLGQVTFQPDARAGLLFLAGLVWAAPPLAGAALVGAAVSSLTARITRAAQDEIDAGLHGFNGALAGVALALFPGGGVVARVLLVLAGAVAAGVLTRALAHGLRRAGLPVLTAPFNLLVLPLLALLHLLTGPLTPAQPLAGGPGFTLLHGTVNGLAQVFFVQGVGPGLLIGLGLVLASPRAAALAVAASGGGAVLALLLGVGPGAVAAGLYGYNSVLVAVALGAAVLVPGRPLLALVAAMVAVPVHLLLAAALGAAGLPGLTVAFVLVSWAAIRLAGQGDD